MKLGILVRLVGKSLKLRKSIKVYHILKEKYNFQCEGEELAKTIVDFTFTDLRAEEIALEILKMHTWNVNSAA